ncbi:hypothetical protein BDA99DRAFT_531963 [Phascolomyces articulosus]|uniref:Tetratricopeptide repeat protein n=1 Tax=Phascolomyces articulosus TaxID=60185 RepID=A0AAD5KP70_9FUNG|nr:hypothetical protein BDA99DRAFT_531963 [Phascolomyces articulosus]
MTHATLPLFPALVQPGDAYRWLTLKDLDLTTIQHAFDQGKTSFTLGDHDQALDCFTHVLDIVQTQLIPTILLYRASVYEMKKKMNLLAIGDAQRSMRYGINPTRPDSYLVRANLMVLQSKFSIATRLYKHGIEMIGFIWHPHVIFGTTSCCKNILKCVAYYQSQWRDNMPEFF